MRMRMRMRMMKKELTALSFSFSFTLCIKGTLRECPVTNPVKAIPVFLITS